MVKKVKWPAPDQIVVSKGTKESEFKLSGYCAHHFLLPGVKKVEHVDLPFLIAYIFFKKVVLQHTLQIYLLLFVTLNAVIMYLNSYNLENRTHKCLCICNLAT